MRNIRLVLSLFICILAVSACNEKSEKFTGIVVNNGRDFLSYDASPRTGTIELRSDTPWTASLEGQVDWVELSRLSGPAGKTELSIELAENDEGQARYTTILFHSETATLRFIVSQSVPSLEFDNTDYNFYLSMGSLPALYAGLLILDNTTPSWFAYSRSGTFNHDLFPAHVNVWKEGLAGADFSEVGELFKNEVLRINRAEPTATFGLYVDDLRSRLGYDLFVAQGIDSSRVKVTMLTDGTATYNNFYKYFSEDGEQVWEKVAEEVNALDWDQSGKYVEPAAGWDNHTWYYYMATMPNYRYMIQDASYLECESSFVMDKIMDMNLVANPPVEILNSLPANMQSTFYKMAGFDFDHYSALFDASDKNNLIIIGTDPTGKDGKAEEQKNYVTQVYDKYRSTHDIFYKPHPSDKTSATYEEDFPGLTLLPGQMPFEIMVWGLMDKIDLIGGYSSTVFITVPPEKVKFLFAKGPQELSKPLDKIFAGSADIEWMGK